MSTATLVVALAAPPTGIQLGGREALEAYAATCGRDASNILLQCHVGSSAATVFSTKTTSELLLVSGDLSLTEDGNTPVLYTRVICPAHPDQYLNEITIVGRVAGEARATESGKSSCRSVAVNRFKGGEEQTDWFRVRAYGYAKDRLEQLPKGALVSICGILDQRTNRDGQPYPEIKARTIKLHGKPRGQATADPSNGKAAGYSDKDFSSTEMPWDWS